MLNSERLQIDGLDETITRTYEDGTGGTVDLRASGYSFAHGSASWTYDAAFATPLSTAWGYNERGELVQANDTTNAYDRAYQYDGIGNRRKTVNGLLTDLPGSDNHSSNGQNQYTSVSGFPAAPAHDADGNAGTWAVRDGGPLATTLASATLLWDAENRLVKVTVGTTDVTYDYDHLSRLVKASDGAGTVHYLYDGWNRIAEYSGTTGGTHVATYLWGLDLSGSPQGAGGVGGLLSMVVSGGGTRYYPAYDGNGNVSEYVNQAGAKVAHFEYDPFGNLTVDADSNAGSFPYRFSTKPQDGVTGLYYYGYRWYDPVTGRWPSRDPIGERGGVNLYGFVSNNPISQADLYGAEPFNPNQVPRDEHTDPALDRGEFPTTGKIPWNELPADDRPPPSTRTTDVPAPPGWGWECKCENWYDVPCLGNMCDECRNQREVPEKCEHCPTIKAGMIARSSIRPTGNEAKAWALRRLKRAMEEECAKVPGCRLRENQKVVLHCFCEKKQL